MTTLVAVENKLSRAASIIIQDAVIIDEENFKKMLGSRVYSFEQNPEATSTSKAPSTPDQADTPMQEISLQVTPTEKFCRICFETEESNELGKFICPCRCDGSLKHIHENCLKTWIMKREPEKDTGITAKCEICSYIYHCEAEKRLIFNCCRSLGDGFFHLLIGTILAMCIGNLFWIMKTFFIPDASQDPGVFYLLISIASVIALGLFIPMIICLKRAFFEVRIVAFKIYNFDPNYQDPSVQPNEPVRIRDNNNVVDIDYEAGGEDRRAADQSRLENPVRVQDQSLNMSNRLLLMLNASHLDASQLS